MRRHFISRTFGAFALLATLTAGLSAPVHGQSPARGPHAEPGARAFWGIPTLPPRPLTLVPDPLALAYYQGARERLDAQHLDAQDLGGQPNPSHPAEWTEGEIGLPAPLLEPARPAPYPYGYFGASGTRHWHRHFGFRQAYIQWTLK